MTTIAHLCAVRTNPEHEIREVEIPVAQVKAETAKLQRKGFETIFVLRTYRFNPWNKAHAK